MPVINSELPQWGRRAAYSVVEVAKLCRLSRARFYELIDQGVMPPPVHCIKTRRPLYPAEIAARCVEVRETNTGFDGRYVMFYGRRATPLAGGPTTSAAPRQRQPCLDPLSREMVESLRAMGVSCPQEEIVEAIRNRCPQGLVETTFERDLLGLYGDLRRPRSD